MTQVVRGVVHKQSRSAPVMRTVLEAVAERLRDGDETLVRIPEVCAATGVNYGSVYHHFGSREGVIDAAYEMMFSRLVDQDMVAIRRAVAAADDFPGFLVAAQEIMTSISSGGGRRSNRSMRLRIVAASVTRPELRQLIGVAQERLTSELTSTIELCQARGWMRSDVDARAVAAMLQIVVFGRNLDDASTSPVPEDEWSAFVFQLFNLLLDPT
ncbi:MAG: TetR/AcrR family transcriptional regulator [Acidimicrobiales bacterium]